jgi:hypothetical protein
MLFVDINFLLGLENSNQDFNGRVGVGIELGHYKRLMFIVAQFHTYAWRTLMHIWNIYEAHGNYLVDQYLITFIHKGFFFNFKK